MKEVKKVDDKQPEEENHVVKLLIAIITIVAGLYIAFA